MERFKASLRKRIALCAMGVVAGVGLLVWLLITGTRIPLEEQTHFAGFFLGFRSGGAALIAVFSLAVLVRSVRALRDSGYMRKLEIQETDERLLFIKRQVGGAYRVASIIALMVATVIAGNYNITVFYTLLCTTFALALLMAGLKLFYNNRY